MFHLQQGQSSCIVCPPYSLWEETGGGNDGERCLQRGCLSGEGFQLFWVNDELWIRCDRQLKRCYFSCFLLPSPPQTWVNIFLKNSFHMLSPLCIQKQFNLLCNCPIFVNLKLSVIGLFLLAVLRFHQCQTFLIKKSLKKKKNPSGNIN